MSDDSDIIDLIPYLDGVGPGAADSFSVYGGAGAASRFALPVWRSVYRVRGDRGLLLVTRGASGTVEPLFVLDLRSDPARTDVPESAGARSSLDGTSPRVRYANEGGGWIAVHLGEDGDDVYHLVLAGVEDVGLMDDPDVRRDVLFLAGECSGLALHWGLHESG